MAGWVLFLVCAVLFLFIAVRSRDLILALASLVFLGGCLAFLIPMLFPASKGGKALPKEGEVPGENDERP